MIGGSHGDTPAVDPAPGIRFRYWWTSTAGVRMARSSSGLSSPGGHLPPPRGTEGGGPGAHCRRHHLRSGPGPFPTERVPPVEDPERHSDGKALAPAEGRAKRVAPLTGRGAPPRNNEALGLPPERKTPPTVRLASPELDRAIACIFEPCVPKSLPVPALRASHFAPASFSSQ